MNASKRILCILMALVLCLSTALIAVSAVGNGQNEANRKYEEQILAFPEFKIMEDGYMYECVMEYNADGSTPDEGENADYVLVFFHTGGVLCWELKETIGNYQLNHTSVYNPYIAGYVIYSTADNKVYSLHEAWYHRLPNMENVLKGLGTKVNFYAEPFEEYFKSEIAEENICIQDIGWYEYRELYYYSDESGGTTEMPEATPDYVLVDATVLGGEYGYAFGVYGDYVVKSRLGNPDTLMYYIYNPADDRIYTLREAFDTEIKGLDNIFTEYGLGVVLGDADGDGKLTVKDATYIQKCLVKTRNLALPKDIVGVSDGVDTSPDTTKLNIADFDLNDKVNIKDATAIQKRLAKITE